MPSGSEPPAPHEGKIVFGRRIVSEFRRQREAEGRVWAAGYTQGELDAAQEKFGLVFPPDLVASFRERRPVRGWDWRSDEADIRAMLSWPLEGLLFDVENDDLWWPEWGERPTRAEDRAAVLRWVVDLAPKLIPLISHRYLPVEPHEAGNPVFSIYQSDVIYYGADLADYFERELGDGGRPVRTPVKRIRFWSELVDRERQSLPTS
ncbi:MAG TPA: SMI1/KNR4 family protein [Caulobacteraceae bacterium]